MIVLKNYKISIIYLVFAIYLFFSITAQRSLVGNATLLLFVFCVAVYCISKQKVFIPSYSILELIFILYSVWQMYSFSLINLSAHRAHLITLTIGMIFNFCLYNFVKISSDYNKIISIYVSLIAFSMFFTSLVYFDTILDGRLTARETVFVFGGQHSTSLAHIAGIALFFAAWRYLLQEEKRFTAYFLITFFTLIILLTGTRKTILLIVASLFFIPLIKSGVSFTSLAKKLIMFFVGVTVLYIVIMNVPQLYNIFGSRLENVITSIIDGDAVDGSMFVRDRIAFEASYYSQIEPLYGWGLDSFGTTLGTDGLYAHNNYLEILVSSGYVGFIIYFSRYFLIMTKLILQVVKSEEKSTALSFIVLVLVLMILEYWQVTFIFRPMMIPYIFILSFLHSNSEPSYNESKVSINCYRKANYITE